MFSALLLSNVLLDLGDTALATLLRQSDFAYPLVSAFHICGISLLFGNILLLDLKLFGILRQQALTELLPLLQRMAALGLLIALLSGTLLFSVQPAHYLSNNAFLIKMLFLLLALLNILLVHRLPAWQAALISQPFGITLKICALISILLWLAVLLAGRWIAFV
ncbi:hypothetical protein GCM10010919_17880 [Alishewanella longhuensis]|uniref:DUF6644 domain-containing protein n=1 Tax=Alishewanella longhuensis TaxID=1091037 RepID=A0ABQ3KXL9_9ALTE|nr:DUF6644 family protein [Alishewanella longhuensis]GHG68688.1 hypothetical protein GCM10010919_17880 [Alishewanella longhuensis]